MKRSRISTRRVLSCPFKVVGGLVLGKHRAERSVGSQAAPVSGKAPFESPAKLQYSEDLQRTVSQKVGSCRQLSPGPKFGCLLTFAFCSKLAHLQSFVYSAKGKPVHQVLYERYRVSYRSYTIGKDQGSSLTLILPYSITVKRVSLTVPYERRTTI